MMSLDTALLSRKLEAYQREQDMMARMRRDWRNDTNAARKVQFVPKFAAKQFVATATPASAKPAIRNHHQLVARIQSIAEPVADHGSSSSSSSAAMLGKKRDSMIYRPGDAARRRRSMFEMSYPSDDITTHSDFHLQRRTSNPAAAAALQDDVSLLNSNHSLDRVKQSTLPPQQQQQQQVEEKEKEKESSRTWMMMSSSSSNCMPRPKLVPNDRPDWIQRSEEKENGHVSQQSHHGLHLFARTKADDSPGAQEREGSVPETGHLVADAVKVIKRQEKAREKSHRRRSVLGFFKKL